MLRRTFSEHLAAGDFSAAAKLLEGHDTLETNVVLFGLRGHARGADAVEDLISGATQKEKERYDYGLSFLATICQQRAVHWPLRHGARHHSLIQGPVRQHQ